MSHKDFWKEVFSYQGSVTPYVLGRVLIFGLISWLVWFVAHTLNLHTGLAVAPYEIIGVVLALLLVMRTNSGYDRWYEARKQWGGIVNQSRNLALVGTTLGPKDREWQREFVRWTAAFAHICRHSLRNEREVQDITHLVGEPEVRRIQDAVHMPSYVAARLALMLRQAVQRGEMDHFAFLRAETERSLLIDYVGACERILKTPLAHVFSIKIRRFLFIYLLALPLAIVDKTGWLTPFVTVLVAYPLLSLDQIGIELQNPFAVTRLSHLPLDEICRTIENNVVALAEDPDQIYESSTNERAMANVQADPKGRALQTVSGN
jgi:putative membrane protein